MSKLRADTQSGFSMIEILIALVILSVLATIAVINFRGAKVDLERQSIVREFKIYLERARFDSVKRRAALQADQANIVLNGPSSFRAQLDFDENRVLGPNDFRIVDFTQRSRTQIVVSNPGIAYPITIRFNQRGQVTATDNLGVAVSPVLFRICSSSTNCTSTSPDTTSIAVSPSGTVAVLNSGQSPSAAPTPVITNTVPTLNCYVLVSNSSTTCRL